MTRIWISHWFSTAYHFVTLIKNNPDNQAFEIIGTSDNLHSVVLTACDINAGLEPQVKGTEYIDFCLDFCRRYQIDVFIPGYRKYLQICPYIEDFSKLGTKVLLCPDNNLLHLFEDKLHTYESIKQFGVMEVPNYGLANTAENFKKIYDGLIEQGHQVCFKPRSGVGGAGFRIIDNHYNSLQTLYYPASARLSFDSAYRLLSTETDFPDLLVSEYLSGHEYSIDCLADAQGQLQAVVPRRKMYGHLRHLENNNELIAIAERFAETYKLPFIFNIQIRYQGGVPKLLEINSRMPGGLHISCLSGVNFPYLAIKYLLQQTVETPKPHLGLWVSEIELAVSLDNPPENNLQS